MWIRYFFLFVFFSHLTNMMWKTSNILQIDIYSVLVFSPALFALPLTFPLVCVEHDYIVLENITDKFWLICYLISVLSNPSYQIYNYGLFPHCMPVYWNTHFADTFSISQKDIKFLIKRLKKVSARCLPICGWNPRL